MIDLKERFDYLNNLKEFKDGYLTPCVSSTCINNAAKVINSNILDSKYIEKINNTEFGGITIIWHIPSILYLAAEITDNDAYFYNRSDEVIFKISPPFDTTQFIKLSMILERKKYNYSIPIESYIDSIKYLCTAQIESFRELEKDWDGHGAPKISISCIINVINIINFQEISCEYINDILANHNGTISIIWNKNWACKNSQKRK